MIYPGYLKRIEIHGTKGTAMMEEEDIVKWDFAKSRAKDKAIHQKMAEQTSGGGGAADPAAIGHHGHACQFRDIVKADQKRHLAVGRRSGRTPLGRGYFGHLQSGRDRSGRGTAAEERSRPQSQKNRNGWVIKPPLGVSIHS